MTFCNEYVKIVKLDEFHVTAPYRSVCRRLLSGAVRYRKFFELLPITLPYNCTRERYCAIGRDN